jgi:hypothetical protein
VKKKTSDHPWYVRRLESRFKLAEKVLGMTAHSACAVLSYAQFFSTYVQRCALGTVEFNVLRTKQRQIAGEGISPCRPAQRVEVLPAIIDTDPLSFVRMDGGCNTNT